MSVAEYEDQFTSLSRYVYHLVSTDTLGPKRFVRGLANPLFSNLLLMIGRMSYVEIMDAAYGLEIGREEQRAAKESGKKQKIKEPFLVDLVLESPELSALTPGTIGRGYCFWAYFNQYICLKVPGW